jgi:tRNA1Val (adenine37-N6)-methyltransferase
MNDVFHFRQFSVRHSHSAMKVGTDGVLLGAWAHTNGASTILDVGTGTGLIALMLAQRTHGRARIDAVEMDKDAAADAAANFMASPWAKNLALHAVDLQHFMPPHPYDLIVSNPPYFNRALKSPDPKRNMVRHTDSLPHQELLSFSHRWLTAKGRLALILPPAAGLEVRNKAYVLGLHPVRTTVFKTRKNKPALRWLMEFSRFQQPEIKYELILYENGLQWTDAYRNLVSEFYLNG